MKNNAGGHPRSGVAFRHSLQKNLAPMSNRGQVCAKEQYFVFGGV